MDKKIAAPAGPRVGGGGGDRTRVRKIPQRAFYERSFKFISESRLPETGFVKPYSHLTSPCRREQSNSASHYNLALLSLPSGEDWRSVATLGCEGQATVVARHFTVFGSYCFSDFYFRGKSEYLGSLTRRDRSLVETSHPQVHN